MRAALDDQLFKFITERTARSDAGAAVHQHVPDDPAGLASTMHELDLTAARAVFDGLTTRTLAYRTPGRYPAAKAATVFRVLAGLLGPCARWFSKHRPAGMHPVTGNVMDALFAGVQRRRPRRGPGDR